MRYETADGGSVGPFPIRFDPDVALFREQKQVLEQMPTNWVEFRDYNGTLIYFTTLVTYRCAITEVRYGLDDGKPLQRYDLPGCNAKDPFSVPSNAQIYLKAQDQVDQPADHLARWHAIGSQHDRAQLSERRGGASQRSVEGMARVSIPST